VATTKRPSTRGKSRNQASAPRGEPRPITTDPPWLQQPQEPALWYQRFEIYRQLGTRRSIDAAYRQEGQQRTQAAANQRQTSSKKRPFSPPTGRAPGEWSTASTVWSWVTRAEAWDRYDLEQQRIAFDKAAAKERDERVKIALAMRGMASQGLMMLAPQMMRPADILAFYRMSQLMIAEIHAEQAASLPTLDLVQRESPPRVREIVITLNPGE
jgi:hypothetical protein